MNLQSNRPSEFQDGRKGLGCSDRARQELTFDVAVPWEFSAFFSYFGERNDGWEKNGWMDGGCFLFPEHFRRPRPLRFPPLSASPTHLDGQTDRKRVSLAQPEVHVLGGHARRMNQMSELFMSCSISGNFVCIQPLPARPRLFDYAQQSSRNWKRYVPLILGRRVRETNHVCHWKNDTRVCVEWENIQQSVCSTSTIVYVRGIFIFRRCSYFPYLLMWYSQICNKTR